MIAGSHWAFRPHKSSLLTLLAFAVLCLALGFSKPVFASDYYVSPSGRDSNLCTFVSPCYTLGAAGSHAHPGDTVHALAGNYGAGYDIGPYEYTPNKPLMREGK